ncbi:hypothetical protein BH23CHL4_BH23CHL4_26020 [soil metagenome]
MSSHEGMLGISGAGTRCIGQSARSIPLIAVFRISVCSTRRVVTLTKEGSPAAAAQSAVSELAEFGHYY